MAKREHIDLILNEIERSQLQGFADNKVLFEAVRKALLHGIYFQGVLKPGEPANALVNFALFPAVNKGAKTNEQVGAELCAKWEGINILEAGFESLKEYQTQEVKTVDKKNPAR